MRYSTYIDCFKSLGRNASVVSALHLIVMIELFCTIELEMDFSPRRLADNLVNHVYKCGGIQCSASQILGCLEYYDIVFFNWILLQLDST
jgi:hypothetical protein